MSIPKRHFILPDTQVRPGVPLHHFRWVGKAIADYAPDVVVHMGDHWDFPSLSRWSADGSAEKEGKRVLADIEAGNEAMDILMKSMGDYRAKKQVLLRGNHEERLRRYVGDRPVLEGAIGFHLFNDKAHGWDVVDYFHGSPQSREIDGIAYAHFFANPNTGKPVGGTIQNRLNKIGQSFAQGHVQGLMQGNFQCATGRTMYGIQAGSCYLHDEEFKGMANAHWRGVVVLNEVRNGQFCEMPLTLDYLCRKYEGMSLARFLQRNVRGAKDKFSLARAA